MRENLLKYTISPSSSVLEALRKIDENRKGFLIVVSADFLTLGTLTDGDIRRGFLSGKDVSSNIDDIFNSNYKYLLKSDDLLSSADIFKNESIKFLPIVDEEKKLFNIITRNQLHAVLLQDIHADLSFDFMGLDENVVDYEIYKKPWGFYKTTVMNDYFQSKIICLNPQAELSFQAHEHREEHWIVAHGNGVAQLEQSIIEVSCGSNIFIPKGCKHRLANSSKTESLIITEVQIGDYFGEDDIIRFEDVYGRT